MIESIPDGDGSSYSMTFDIDSNLSVEHVELGVDLRHQRMGDLTITLTSPDGTVSSRFEGGRGRGIDPPERAEQCPGQDTNGMAGQGPARACRLVR